jgi:protein-S-isoprenylcysteine O-methyltransferase Ste14
VGEERETVDFVCEASGKINSMKNKNAQLVFGFLFYSGLLLLCVSFFFKRNGRTETVTIIEWIYAVLIIAALIVRLTDWAFPQWFNNRPSREEIEKKIVDKQ